MFEKMKHGLHGTFGIGLCLLGSVGATAGSIGLPCAHAESIKNSISQVGISGIVTQVREHTIVVNGMEYGFSPKVIVLDHEGHGVDLSYITRNSEVHFRLMKDDSQKIEWIVVRQPE